MRKITILLVWMTVTAVAATLPTRVPYRDPKLPVDLRVSDRVRIVPDGIYARLDHIINGDAFVTVEGNGRGRSNAYIRGTGVDVGADLFHRGLCLPSDNKMTPEQQDVIIDIIRRCFQ